MNGIQFKQLKYAKIQLQTDVYSNITHYSVNFLYTGMNTKCHKPSDEHIYAAKT